MVEVEPSSTGKNSASVEVPVTVAGENVSINGTAKRKILEGEHTIAVALRVRDGGQTRHEAGGEDVLETHLEGDSVMGCDDGEDTVVSVRCMLPLNRLH